MHANTLLKSPPPSPIHTLKIHTCSYTLPHHTLFHTTHTYEPGCSVIHEPFSSSISTTRQWNSLLPTSKLGVGGGRGRDGRRKRRKDGRREEGREGEREGGMLYLSPIPTHTLHTHTHTHTHTHWMSSLRGLMRVGPKMTARF